MQPYEEMGRPIDGVLGRLENVKKSGNGYTARCPGHDDWNNSLSIGEGDDGRVLLYCHPGCEIGSILAKIGLETSDLFPRGGSRSTHPTQGETRTPSNGPRRIIATYDYRAPDGTVLYQVV